MNKIKNIFFLILSLSFSFASAQNSKTIDLELRQIENNLKNEFENSLKTLVGEDTPFAVQIYLKPSNLIKKEQTPTMTGSLGTFETGYMTLPVSDMKLEKSQQADVDKALKPYESFEVVLTLSDDIDVQKRNQIVNFAKSYFKQYSPKISEQKFISSKEAKDKKTDSDAEKSKLGDSAKEVKEKKTDSEADKSNLDDSAKDQKWQFFVYPVLIFLSLISLLVGVYLLSRSFGLGASSISEAIAQLRNIQIEKKSALLEKPKAEEKSKIDFLASVGFFKDQKEKNIEIIEQACINKPDCIVKAFNSEDADYWGAVWLLTEMKSESRLILKNILGENFFRNSNSVKPSPFDPYGWLQDVTEKVTLFQIQGDNEFEAYLNPDEIRQLFLWDKEEFKNLVVKDTRPAAWKMAQDLLNKGEFSNLTEGIDQQIWKAVINANEATKQELRSVYSDYEKKLSSGGQSLKSKVNVKKYKLLLPELLKKYQQLAFAEDELFLEEILQSQPELYQLLKSELLTLSDFKRIPVAFLKNFLSQLNTQQVFSLIVSLPESEKSWIDSLIPEGNRKLIIKDLLSQASNMDRKTKLAALKEAKGLFVFLKNCEKNGDFEYETSVAQEVA